MAKAEGDRGMGRLMEALLLRVESFSDSIIDISERAMRERKMNRIAEQISACGTSVGANTYEADEAMSRADFARAVAIVLKELNESRFWVRTCMRRQWVPLADAAPVDAEAAELKSIFGAILSRTRANGLKKSADPARSARA